MSFANTLSHCEADAMNTAWGRRKRFTQLWRRNVVAGSGDNAHDAFMALHCGYASGTRHYHDWSHIDELLETLDQVRAHCTDVDTLELAIWFHDAVFEAGNQDNESGSARLFAQLAQHRLPAAQISAVQALIMATCYDAEPLQPDAQLLADIDLSPLALPAPAFMRNTRRVRAEFAQYSQQEFLTSQRAFVSNLLQRPCIYLTPSFYHQCEQVARRNLHAYLQRIDAGNIDPPSTA